MRIDSTAQKFTVFFGAPDPKTGKVVYGGTGFLVLHREEGEAFPYLVTARHVAQEVQPQSEITVRINNKDGKTSTPLKVDDIFWAYHPDPLVDVAVTPAYLNPADWDVGYYDLANRVQPTAQP